MKRNRWLLALVVCLVLLSVFAATLGRTLFHTAVSQPRITPTTRPANAPNLTLMKQPTPTATPTPLPTPTPTPTPTPVPVVPTPTPAPSGTGTNGAGTGNTNASWTLIFSDDFNGTQLDPTWGTYGGPHGGGKSYYDPSEVTVQGGMLHVWIDRKTTNGYAITSGGLAAFRLAQVYGKYEFRAKLPHGKGINPYTILWPNQNEPNTAQVDLFESPPVNKDTLYCTNHGADGISDQVQAHGNFADDFHTFTYEWVPGQIRFYVDGVLQGTLTKDIPAFSMWFGIAVSSGDAFTGDPDPTTAFPVSLDVDWVHIYKYNG